MTSEDLWDLSLNVLNDMAVAVDTTVNASGKTFLASPDRKASKQLEADKLRLEVLVSVIDTKQADNAAKRAAAQVNARRAFLTGLRDKKQLDQLESLSMEDIDRELEALGTTEEG